MMTFTRHTDRVVNIVLLCVVASLGCRNDTKSSAEAKKEAEEEQIRRLEDIGHELERSSDLMLRIVGQVDDERFVILRTKGIREESEVVVNRREFEEIVRGTKASNGVAIIVMPAQGFGIKSNTNLVNLLKTNGFLTVRVFAERWGRRFPVPETH
jgi:hypothetical protein